MARAGKPEQKKRSPQKPKQHKSTQKNSGPKIRSGPKNKSGLTNKPGTKTPFDPEKKTGPKKKPGPKTSSAKKQPRKPRTEPAGDPQTEKLQKVLADAGLGSRREMERWIDSGRVQVNDQAAHLGQRVTAGDRVSVDDKPVRRSTRPQERVLLYNKPVGEVCTRSDPERRRTVFDHLPEAGRGRWISIGRLDIATSGLLILTTDGTLANRMMHPSTGLDREYAVRVNGILSDEQRQALIDGIVDDGETLAFSDIQYFNGRGTNHWYHVVLMEGRNREIRRLFEHCGLMVSRLKRVRFGPVVLPSRLARGRSEDLTDEDTAALYRIMRLKRTTQAGRLQKSRRSSVLIPYPEIDKPGG